MNSHARDDIYLSRKFFRDKSITDTPVTANIHVPHVGSRHLQTRVQDDSNYEFLEPPLAQCMAADSTKCPLTSELRLMLQILEDTPYVLS